MKPYFDKHTELQFQIIGHTDAIGSDTYNQKLGMKRAIAVKNLFMEQGIAENRMNVSSKGETDPVADNSSVEGRAKNRRTEITLK